MVTGKLNGNITEFNFERNGLPIKLVYNRTLKSGIIAEGDYLRVVDEIEIKQILKTEVTPDEKNKH